MRALLTGARIRVLPLAVAGAVLALSACSQDADVPTGPMLTAAADHVVDDVHFGHLEVCKAGVGSGMFSVVGTGQISSTTPEAINYNFPLDAGFCHVVFGIFIAPGVGTTANVTITETPDLGYTVGSVSKTEFLLSNLPNGTTTAATNPQSVVVGDDAGWVVTFTNDELGNEGCTPGYYKNLKKHAWAWDEAGYDPDDLVSDVFDTALYPALGAATLHEGLSFKGGNSVEEKAETLLRAAIAAVLNANNSVDFSISSADVIAMTNVALASGDAATIIALAGEFDAANNGPGGCPLGNAPRN